MHSPMGWADGSPGSAWKGEKRHYRSDVGAALPAGSAWPLLREGPLDEVSSACAFEGALGAGPLARFSSRADSAVCSRL